MKIFCYKNLIKNLGKKEIVFSILLSALLLFAIPAPTFAQFGIDRLLAYVNSLPIQLPLAIISLLILLSGVLVALLTGLLELVISPIFIALSYTRSCPGPPNCNPIITLGLNTTQQFVNLFLVVILVYIALAIALRAGEYDAKKLFPKLIIVALLVNFAPVFIGLIVDAANIIMNYFLSPLQGGLNQIQATVGAYDDMYVTTLGKWGPSLSDYVYVLGGSLIMLFMNMIVAHTFWIFAGLFFTRYIAIWVLVITAPLAFAFWVLPQTNYITKFWWKHLVSWSFIGIPVAFFLYLGIASFAVLTQNLSIQPSLAGLGSLTTETFSKMLPLFAVMVFLRISLALLKALGASSITGVAQAFKKMEGIETTVRVASTAALGAAGLSLAAKTGLTALLTKLGTQAKLPTLKEIGKDIAGAKGWGKAGAVAKHAGNIATWGVKRYAGGTGLRMQESYAGNISKYQAEAKGASNERMLAELRSSTDAAKRTAYLQTAIEEKRIKDLKKLGLTDQEIVNIGRQTRAINLELFKKIRDTQVHLRKEFSKDISQKDRVDAGIADFSEERLYYFEESEKIKHKIVSTKDPIKKAELQKEYAKTIDKMNEVVADETKYVTIETKIVANIKPKLIAEIDEDYLLKNAEAIDAQHNFWNGGQFAAAAEAVGSKFIDTFNDYAKKHKKANPNFYTHNNPKLQKYSNSTPGKSLGMIDL